MKSKPRSARVLHSKPIELVPRVLNIRKILVPTDFSAPAIKALHYAVSFAEQFDAKISLLHVSPTPYYTAELGGFPTMVPAEPPPTEVVKKRLESEIELRVPPSARGKAIVRIGPAFDEICKAAQSMSADLIIISTHGHSGWTRALLGSTAERVVRHATCPVLVVREHEHEFA